jgi:hypothetical protein
MRTNVIIDDDLLDRVRHAAEASGRSVSAIVREALTTWLQRGEPDFSWAGRIKVKPGASSRWEDIEHSITDGWSQESAKKVPAGKRSSR